MVVGGLGLRRWPGLVDGHHAEHVLGAVLQAAHLGLDGLPGLQGLESVALYFCSHLPIRHKPGHQQLLSEDISDI